MREWKLAVSSFLPVHAESPGEDVKKELLAGGREQLVSTSELERREGIAEHALARPRERGSLLSSRDFWVASAPSVPLLDLQFSSPLAVLNPLDHLLRSSRSFVSCLLPHPPLPPRSLSLF